MDTDMSPECVDVETTINPLSQALMTKMSREVAFIKLVAASLHTGLEQPDDIHLFRMLDHPKEGAALLVRIIVKAGFGLDTKFRR